VPEKKVCVIIPALNEQETLGSVIEEIPKELLEGRGYRVDVVVVDNNSTDRTKWVAEERGARVILEPVRGKGMAIRTAFQQVNADFLFILDGDYTYPATYIPQMLELLERDHDVVLGCRLKGKMPRGAMSSLNRVGNHLIALMANVLYGTRISDPCTGYWGFRKDVVGRLKLDASGFDIEANMLTEVARHRCRIAELPVDYRRRATPAKLNSLRDGFRIGKTLLRNRFRST